MPFPSAAQLPKGFAYSAAACGLKKNGLDLGLLASEVPAAAACVFTTNLVKAAPVLVSQEHLRRSAAKMRGLIVNSGNANCASGPEGISASRETALAAAQAILCRPEQILVCSTGVIGVPLRVQRILRSVPALNARREGSARSFRRFARAIMTTDTRPKWAAAKCTVGGKPARFIGCAKGAGMIQPRMATMLAFVATDANAPVSVLRRALREAVGVTFNRITVDGDTSTNDTLALFANAASGGRPVRDGAEYGKFLAALTSICHSLALQIVADGEGAHRVIEIQVQGASSAHAADQIARTIANSPLVKTALAGGDPNWGRVLAAAGRAGVHFNPNRAEIRMAGILMCHAGQERPFSERKAHRAMLARHVPIVVDLHAGKASARVWTCDFTGDYVRINASYRT